MSGRWPYSGETGDQVAVAHVLHSLAQVKLELDEYDTAKELLSDALQLAGPRIA